MHIHINMIAVNHGNRTMTPNKRACALIGRLCVCSEKTREIPTIKYTSKQQYFCIQKCELSS